MMNEREIVKNATLDSVCAKIKDSFVYDLYKKAVKNDKEKTRDLLQVMTMIDFKSDREKQLELHAVAYDSLFTIIEFKLKEELKAMEGDK